MPTRLRRLRVALPVLAIGALEAAADSYLEVLVPGPAHLLVDSVLFMILALAFARLAYQRIDRLGEAVRERNEQLERRNASLEALRRVGVALTALVRSEDILHAVVESARQLLEADVAFIAVVLPDGTNRLAATSGPADAFAALDARADDPRDFVRPPALRARLAAPLQRGEATIGTLVIGSRARERPYEAAEYEVLSSLASQASIALEKDRLLRELRELAIRGERERIAREMHDGLAQVLGYVNTKAQAAEELLAKGQTERARQQLQELATAARSVYVDVREAILGLSSPIAPERGLVGAIEEYATRFSEASKLAAPIEASVAAQAVRLAPEVQAQVFRIVQEALTNVRKHAAAGRARIALDVRDHELLLAVEDDGQGFDVEARPTDGWPHYGMQAIRERAASINARASWAARPGAGTVFTLSVPLGAAGRSR